MTKSVFQSVPRAVRKWKIRVLPTGVEDMTFWFRYLDISGLDTLPLMSYRRFEGAKTTVHQESNLRPSGY